MRDVKHFNARQMGGANMIMPASCAFLKRVDFCIILHFPDVEIRAQRYEGMWVPFLSARTKRSGLPTLGGL